MSAERRGRIYLVGFMGSGKTCVGRLLARELGYAFLDLDERIEQRRGLSVADIFAQDGEAEFRRLESAALRETITARDTVIATGGGTLTRWENRELIQKHGVMVWLDAPLETMLLRCRGGARRPLLSTDQRMAALLEERLPGYRAAELRADAAAAGPEQTARMIAARLGALTL